MTAPPIAATNPTAPAPMNPVSLAIGAAAPLLLLVVTPVDVVAFAVADAVLLLEWVVTGHALVQGMAEVNGKSETTLALANTGACEAIAGLG